MHRCGKWFFDSLPSHLTVGQLQGVSSQTLTQNDAHTHDVHIHMTYMFFKAGNTALEYMHDGTHRCGKWFPDSLPSHLTEAELQISAQEL